MPPTQTIKQVIATVFKPNGLITLTTDFGTHDPFVGVMKGVILSRFTSAKIVDLTHEIPAYLPATAGFWLSRSWPYFSAGTVHLAVVDPGVGTARGMVLLQAAQQVFIAPDNGLLDAVARSVVEPEWWRIELDSLQGIVAAKPSNTFHGRDIFAPLVAEIAAGRLLPEAVGTKILEPDTNRSSAAAMIAGEYSGHIVAIDHFGNLITDLDGVELQRFLRPEIHFREQVFVPQDTYGVAAPGAVVAVVNAFGVVELAQMEGSAQRYFGATYGERVRVCEANRSEN